MYLSPFLYPLYSVLTEPDRVRIVVTVEHEGEDSRHARAGGAGDGFDRRVSVGLTSRENSWKLMQVCFRALPWQC